MRVLLSLSLLTFLFSNSYNGHTQQIYNWAKSSAGGSDETAISIATEKTGNVYHTGTFTGTADLDPGAGVANLVSTGMADIYFSRYDNNGNFVWAKSIGSTQNDQSVTIATDDTNNVYLMGYARGTIDMDPGSGVDAYTPSFADMFVAKYDSIGNYKWGKHLPGPNGNFSRHMAVDKAGNIYIAGELYNSIDFDPASANGLLWSTGANLFFAKYNNNGNYIRSYTIGDNMNQSISMGSFVLDSLANMYVVGSFSASGSFDFDPGAGTAPLSSFALNSVDVFFAKYDSAGNYLMAKSISDNTTDDEYGLDIAVRGNGDIYLCGSLGPLGSGFGGINADFDPGPGVVNLPGGAGTFIARYDNAGNYIYAKGLYSPTNSLFPISMAVNASGDVYLAGTLGDTLDADPGTGVYNMVPGNQNIFYAKYDDTGHMDFAYTLGGTHNCGANAMALDTFNNVYIAGSYTDTIDFDLSAGVANLAALQGNDMVIAKYRNIPIANMEVIQVNTLDEILLFPNPAKQSITVSSGSNVNEIRLTNVMGQLLQTSTANTIYLADYAPGVYFIQVSTTNGVFSGKFVKE